MRSKALPRLTATELCAAAARNAESADIRSRASSTLAAELIGHLETAEEAQKALAVLDSPEVEKQVEGRHWRWLKEFLAEFSREIIHQTIGLVLIALLEGVKPDVAAIMLKLDEVQKPKRRRL